MATEDEQPDIGYWVVQVERAISRPLGRLTSETKNLVSERVAEFLQSDEAQARFEAESEDDLAADLQRLSAALGGLTTDKDSSVFIFTADGLQRQLDQASAVDMAIRDLCPIWPICR